MNNEVVVRAIDVGYGHVKFSDGYNPDGALRVESFPSQSPVAKGDALTVNVMKRRDTFFVPVGKRTFEVGKDVADALHGNQESAVMDTKFALSDAYTARLLGAINYMAPNLPDNTIDFLILGLPLTTYMDRHKEVAKRFTGKHVINARGDTVVVHHCEVYPQPLGSYAAFIEAHDFETPPRALVIDPGYNTVDWFVCKGMVASEIRSAAIQRGMSAVIKNVAEAIIKKLELDAGVSEIVRLVDTSLTNGTPLAICGEAIDLKEFMSAGDSVIEEAAQAVKNSIAAGADIDAIVIAGGGASLYAAALAKHFRHRVELLPDPSFANVRGFQALGETQAESAHRAVGAGAR
jgi:plasmid segregation protein ParM